MWLDNLVFYYDSNQFDNVTARLKEFPHCFKVNWELNTLNAVWKRAFAIFLTDPFPIFINNFHSIGENAAVRCFPLQVYWLDFVNSDMEYVSKCEERQLYFMVELLRNIEIKQWHFELTLAIANSDAIYRNIVKPLQSLGWRLLSLHPDPNKILQRDKFLLWHLVHPSRKIYVKGYVANSAKYPKGMENLTKTELYVPMMDFQENAADVLKSAQRIRNLLLNYDLLKDSKQVVWCKMIVHPEVFTWFNNANSLNLAWSFFKFSKQEHEVSPFPNIYASQEETEKLLREVVNQLLGYFVSKSEKNN